MKLGDAWMALRDEILGLAEQECTDIRLDIFEVIAAQLVLEATEIESRGLRIAVYRHLELGASEQQLLELCDQLIDAAQLAVGRAVAQPMERDTLMAVACGVGREVITVVMLAAVERAIRVRDKCIRLEQQLHEPSA